MTASVSVSVSRQNMAALLAGRRVELPRFVSVGVEPGGRVVARAPGRAPVEATVVSSDEDSATLKIVPRRQAPRLLAARSEFGYVESPGAALVGEPEALEPISPEWQRRAEARLQKERDKLAKRRREDLAGMSVQQRVDLVKRTARLVFIDASSDLFVLERMRRRRGDDHPDVRRLLHDIEVRVHRELKKAA